MKGLFELLFLLCFSVMPCAFATAQNNYSENVAYQAKAIIARYINADIAEKIIFTVDEIQDPRGSYSYKVVDGQLYIRGNSAVSLCHAFYDYLKTTEQGMIAWGGKNINIQPLRWKAVTEKKVQSPYQYHYYMNVVTHGYSTPYWDWKRWDNELDWIALHGLDMVLINSSYEAIMYRVFKKIGVKEEAIRDFFPGPAFQPWNRMGNISGWDGPPPASWYDKQIMLTHQVLNKMRHLQMTPIIQSFSGFVPEEIIQVYPEAEITPIVWVSNFPEKNRCNILLPSKKNAELFIQIGSLFVKEWEEEFGKEIFFLADSFNEMQVPRKKEDSEETFQQQLSDYGEVVYQSFNQGDEDAIWTMQGWTFGYQHEDWTPDRLNALVKKTPDEKVLFLDLANDYNLNWWHIEPGWKYFKGFSNKKWIYSFIPNMGGKTPWNGVLQTYAEAPIEALHYKNKGNLIGFGFAPEGIENNELIYELLSDIGWRDEKINLNQWIKNYCINRYGSYSETMNSAYQNFLQSCYGTFTDHPRFDYQMKSTVNKNSEFFNGVEQFLACYDQCKNSILYKNDAIELTAQYLSLVADAQVKEALLLKGKDQENRLNKVYSILKRTDRLLLSHPNNKLDRWVGFAEAYGDNSIEKKYYAQDARRIITSWGPGVGDYAAKMWGGLIYSYYLERLKSNNDAIIKHYVFDQKKWEENWIQNGDKNPQSPFKNPLKEAQKLIKENAWKD
ncbi:hypothetical protein B0A81_18715 [Flavobacterium plurextorum]|uniref:Alpha-N-acetylglucosaminidase n=1 Tax=Flavobacterium plurextorum TaxID=1114867 RepID=A0ABX4CR61_9FLAO|nr:alpha-N-acetylglucosaminidase TIM-barrel domain-containing protein [Flavobacterium plurextorum]OXB03364.1 hypothetical protein B0A81_18715 [Flavobacterium plurextorum]